MPDASAWDVTERTPYIGRGVLSMKGNPSGAPTPGLRRPRKKTSLHTIDP